MPIILISRGILFLCFFFTFENSFSQEIKVFSKNDSLPIVKANFSLNGVLIGMTDNGGKYEIKGNKTNIDIKHLGYKDLKINKIINDTIVYLEREYQGIEEVTIKKEKKKSFFERNIQKMVIGETNFSFKQKGIVLFKKNNKEIKNIKLEVIDVFGVKNIKYRPFKIAIYEFDSIKKSLGNKIFESELLEKNDNKKFFNFVLNKKIEIRSSCFYVAFEILDSKYYNPKFIQSKRGLIAAVPSLKLKRVNEGNSFRISYNENDEIICFEKIKNGGFNMKIEYNE